MVSESKAIKYSVEEGINQGDIFRDVKYSFIDEEDEESVDIIEYVFPYAIVVSQSCDVAFMDKFESGEKVEPVKFMPSILMCPIYPKELTRHAKHLQEVFDKLQINLPEGSPYYNKDDIKIAEKDQHVRFHALKVTVNGKTLIEEAVIDYKHIFSVPMKYLRNHRNERICTIEDIYTDQIVNQLAAYISRIGLPDIK